MSKLRIVFMGTGDIAIPSFLGLVSNGLIALVTQPDKPVGRKQVLTPPRIKQKAIEYGIEVIQPKNARDQEFVTKLSDLKPDIVVVMAYGQILSQKLLDIPPLAFINLHASLLPKYRGAACIQAAIDAGDSTTGITVMHVIKALDAGDIIIRKEIPIGDGETGGELHERLAEISPELLLEAIELVASGNAPRIQQDESQVSYIPKLMRCDGELDWSLSADHIQRRICAYDPWPGTFTVFTETSGRHKGRKKRLKIFPHTEVIDHFNRTSKPGEILSVGDRLVIACGKNALRVDQVQVDGSRRMSSKEFLLSSPFSLGDMLG